jgi:hypothetical protein
MVMTSLTLGLIIIYVNSSFRLVFSDFSRRFVMRGLALSTVFILVMASSAMAVQTVYNVTFSGAQEVGGGDPNGTATGTLTLDPDPGIYGTISVNLVYSNLDTLNGFHIHAGNAGVNGGIHIPLTLNTTGGAGTLNYTLNDGNWGTGGHPTWLDSQIAAIVANPTGFYLNLHTNEFSGGAIRAQLPEPASLGLLGVGALVLIRRNRRM